MCRDPNSAELASANGQASDWCPDRSLERLLVPGRDTLPASEEAGVVVSVQAAQEL